MMDLRLVCCRVIRMKLSKCWGCISLIYVLLPFIPSFLAVIIKYDVSLPTKKVTGILLLIVISGSLFSACQFAYKDAKIKSVQSIYTSVAICYLYTVFQSQLFCFSSERASKITLNCKHGAVFSIISQGYRY